MFNIGSNQVLLLVVLLLVSGVGTYVTYVRQRTTLSALNEKIEARREKKQEVESLRASLNNNENALAAARARWRSRYKRVPDTITSTDVMARLATLTQTGFRTFDVVSAGRGQEEGYSVHRFNAEGTAFFSSLYRLVWRLENGRSFYRVRDLQLRYLEKRTTGTDGERPSLDVLVSFQMTVEAVYGIVEDTLRRSLPTEAGPAGGQDVGGPQLAESSIPPDVGPPPTPSINPFYPLVFEEVPPNEEGRLNVEAARLVSIVGGQAVFETSRGTKRVREGDRVYLGTIIEVDASAGRVVARLNKGGIVERIERLLHPERSAPRREPNREP